MTPEQDKIVQKITQDLADRGLIIEGGWQALFYLWNLTDAPLIQKEEIRKAYFSGAQHLFASIMATLDSGKEATDADLARMVKIAAELRKFADEMRAEIMAKRGLGLS